MVLRNTVNDCLKTAQQNKRNRNRAAAVLTALSVIVSLNVFMGLRQPGVTMAGTAMCGREEHTHTDECYEKELVCTLSESAHTHSEACYEERTAEPRLSCTRTEDPHEHTEACYETRYVEPHEESTLACTNTAEDHVHDTSCYSVTWVEGYEERVCVCALVTVPHEHTDACHTAAQTEKTLVCGLDETGHTHGEECYVKHLVCTQEEHVHSLDCYADETADVETQLDWQNMLAPYITGELREDIVAIARSQIGYAESTRNFTVNADGVRSGYTRYGAWYGAPYSDWSAMFVSFCLHYAGSEDIDTPYNIGAASMAELWNNAGRYAAAREYTPEIGDLIFLEENRVGIVTSVSFDVLTVVQGDVENAVTEETMMSYESSILGYGILEFPEPVFGVLSAGSAANTEPEGEPAEADLTPTPTPAPDEAPAEPEEAALTEETLVLAACDCGNEGLAAISHADGCTYKTQLRELADEKTAEELFALWPQLPADAQDYVLQYLFWNYAYAAKLEELKALLDGAAGAEDPWKATCGDVEFEIAGELPETAVLQVTDPQYDSGTMLSCINPNIRSYVNYMAVYDITITDNGVPYTPASPVTVTVTIPELVFDPLSEFFIVAHLDANTGTVLSREYVDVAENTVTFAAESFSPYMFYTIAKESEGGEKVLGTNWMSLAGSGFFTYWEQFLGETDTQSTAAYAMDTAAVLDEPSDVQIDNWGGESTNGDGVVVSKTIAGTDLENVFDITLTVQTQQSISEIYEEPDMAVVIVMDISNTMNDNFGNVTRYEAAMLAAESFLDQFAAKTASVSKIGYVAFNTDAHQIFGLSPCSTTAEATALKNTMRQATGSIINASGYAESHSRFTNIEAGLKMGADMLEGATNENKYIIFLSDGFPTTYVSSGYSGYDPYTPSGTPGSDGVFYDSVVGTHCDYGTSYSDKAAIRASSQAADIKKAGIKIFSIGVDIGGQTIAKYEREGKKDFSVIDRTGTSYEIGDASSTESYVNWLRNSIGSGYYYDSTDADGLQAAYNKIFAEILRFKEEASKADWVAQDPIPLAPPEYIEFIGFYDKNGTLSESNLKGSNAAGAENTAVFAYDSETELDTITWDLKESGYTVTTADGTTTYYYTLSYRVRLKNELESFKEDEIYKTNATTSLTYRVFESVDGNITLSEQRKVEFQIPEVHGYLAELTFKKVDSYKRPLAGAEFALTHDDAVCPVCRGDGKNHVTVSSCTAISDGDGTVTFTGIPSGHTYTLTETKAPPGFVADGRAYKVVVSYDEITMEEYWTGTVINKTSTEFPATGGSGTLPCVLTGLTLISGAAVCGFIRRRRRERGRGA